ncbi:hypothetical protein E2C01_068824 [Portunus trituberculatus]|uniref:Uncharacterized protein n=1 Tax=Portunus trituberculatus TaxID=210409 RepID=A0A5B7HX92_PORTR|nr:hypothetical protein [Portunus trituberculatus]
MGREFAQLVVPPACQPLSRPQQRFPDSPRTNSTPCLPTPRGATAMHLTRTSLHGVLHSFDQD